MTKRSYILFFLLLAVFQGFSQERSTRALIEIEGTVKGKENYQPISGVSVSTDTGYYTTTNGLGEFKIRASIGDLLIFESADFETVRHRITSDEDIAVQVTGYAQSRASKRENKASFDSRSTINHQRFLDSANTYKKTNLEKSIDFIAQSMAQLGKRGNKTELSNSFTALGEIYMYHQQYDLAISSFKDALGARKSVKTELLLGQAYILNGEHENAQSTLLPLEDVKGLIPYQRIEIYEGLGDANKGLQNAEKALGFYREGLQIAQKNQISPKVIDLNSKMAEAYASNDRFIEAEGFFNNSLNLSKTSSS